MNIKHSVFTVLFLLSISLASFAQNTDIELVKKHVNTLASDNMLGRGFGSASGAEAAAYIRTQFIEAGIEPLLEDYYHEFIHRSGILNINGRNVVGVVYGNDPELKNEYIILGAHYDHLGWEFDDEGDTLVYNGADDNASGVASIIELGRYFAAHQPELKRSIILIGFDGEESGLIGSTRFVNDSVVEPGAIKAMFSIDMVGMYDLHGGIELTGIELLKDHAVFMDRATATNSIIVKKTDGSIENRTDTAPFGNAGIPAIYVNTGIQESNYHQPEDDIEFIDFEGMVTIIDFMSELAVALSQDETLAPTNTMKALTKSGGMKRMNPGIKLNTGSTYFDYPDAYFQSKSIFALGVGFFLETRISQWISIQPEVIYETDGGMQDDGNIVNLRTHSVSTPVSLLITSPDPGNNGVRGYYQLGGYFTYTFAGKLGSSSMDFSADYNKQQFGLIMGGGIEILNFRMGYTHKRSFVDFLKTDGPEGNIILNGSYFIIGWAF